MFTARFGFLALTALALLGCTGKSSSGDSLPAPFLLEWVPLVLEAEGGSAFSDYSSIGSGAGGGDITVRASADIQFASAESGPEAPLLPAAPTTGTELSKEMIAAGAPIDGNILISSTLQISGAANPATITTNNGDVVILGSLVGERSSGTRTNDIAICAPAGTIFVMGSLRTAGTAGSPDNPDGGDITLTAQHVVILGSIDARGLSGRGGNGGNITIDATVGDGSEILYAAGSIAAMGGDGAAQGGNGGIITLSSVAPMSIFAPLFAQGGSAATNLAQPVGGNGGGVVLRGDHGGNLSTVMLLNGGRSVGYAQGAVGGSGGTFTADGAGAWRIFGTLNTSGGNATAAGAGVNTLAGGPAGAVLIGVTTRVEALELGRGSYSTNGGMGLESGGNAGSIDVASLDGNITVGGALAARGGQGAPGGSVTITTDADPSGNSSNHDLSAATVIDTRGGTDDPNGGNGGPVLLQCGGNLRFVGEIFTSGFPGGGHAGSISLVVNAANLAPTGALTVSGMLVAEGAPAGIFGLGNGGDVLFSSAGALTSKADVSTKGGGAYGHAGSITLQAVSGDIQLSGSISAVTYETYAWPYATPGNLTVVTAGSIVVDGVIDVSGESAFFKNSDVSGADGGTVSFTSTGAGGSITLLDGTDIKANGGDSSFAMSGSSKGGDGGRILFTTVDQAVSMAGMLTAKGGSAPDVPGHFGGFGGQVVVNSDSDGNMTGGAITLAAGSLIDVSGGSGFEGGQALNNDGATPADSSGINLAVVFDAAGGLTASPDSAGVGIVQNLGMIVATGGSVVARGGDIWFDGRNGSGAEIGADAGALILAGPAGVGVFFPN